MLLKVVRELLIPSDESYVMYKKAVTYFWKRIDNTPFTAFVAFEGS